MKRLSSSELPYDVAAVDIVAEGPGLIVSEITLSPGQEVPWHFHNQVSDTFYGLIGCITVRFDDSGEARLTPGESVTVPAGIPHRVSNESDGVSRFLIVQGIGEYDFIPTPAPGRSFHE